MEQKIIRPKIYEDDQYLVIKNPIQESLTVYIKKEDDFHNKFTEEIVHLAGDHKNRLFVESLLYKLLIKGDI